MHLNFYRMDWILASTFNMRSLKFLLFLSLLSLSLNTISQKANHQNVISQNTNPHNCIIMGISPDYANVESPVYTIANPLTGSRSIIDTLHFDDRGSFQINLTLSELTVLYFDLGRYEGYFYALPGYTYNLSLPPYAEKTHYNNINPYYKPFELHLRSSEYRIMGTNEALDMHTECNNLLFRFDTLFNRANEQVLIKRQNNVFMDVDSVMKSLEKNFTHDSSEFFMRYRKYRYGLLSANGGKMGLEDLSVKFLNDRVPRINEQAYMDLFNVMFDDFFMYYSRTDDGKNITAAINRKQSLTELRQALAHHNAIFSDTLADLLIIKEISQHYYENYFIKDALLIILDSIAASSPTQANRLLALEMHKQFSSLRTGSAPPEFSMRDQDGNFTSLANFKGKYVYIYFCTPDNYSCMMEYPFLESFHEKHGEYLEILTIMVAENIGDMNQFMKQNNYKWRALYYKDQPDILKTYNIRYYPTSFLVGPDGNLIQSPATLPSEGFQQQLFRIMRSKGDI